MSVYGCAKYFRSGVLSTSPPARRVVEGGALARPQAAACIGCGACVAACPKQLSLDFIAPMNRDWLRAKLTGRKGA